MAVSLVSTGVTFPDNTTQTTAASAVTAGNGISVSSGTVAVACPTFNTVGSYCFIAGNSNGTSTVTFSSGSNYSAGTSQGQVQSVVMYLDCGYTRDTNNNLSGTWKWMAAPMNNTLRNGINAVGCRVS